MKDVIMSKNPVKVFYLVLKFIEVDLKAKDFAVLEGLLERQALERRCSSRL